MLRIDRPEQPEDERDAETEMPVEKPACVALVPVTPRPSSFEPSFRLVRPDPSFVAQLIATAEHLPQTRRHRRAVPADALLAYGARQDMQARPFAGPRTRQIA